MGLVVLGAEIIDSIKTEVIRIKVALEAVTITIKVLVETAAALVASVGAALTILVSITT